MPTLGPIATPNWSTTTLKSLHAYLRMLEIAADLKRKLPTASNPRSVREGLAEMNKLVGLDPVVFRAPQNIAAALGAQRFVMI